MSVESNGSEANMGGLGGKTTDHCKAVSRLDCSASFEEAPEESLAEVIDEVGGFPVFEQRSDLWCRLINLHLPPGKLWKKIRASGGVVVV